MLPLPAADAKLSLPGLLLAYTTGAGPVLDNELLAETFRQPLSHQSRNDVGPLAGGKADDQVYRPRWIGLCPCEVRDGWECGSACRQMQKSTARKFHDTSSLMPQCCK